MGRAGGEAFRLRDLDDARLRELWHASVRRRHPAGQVLRHAGAPATHLLLPLRATIPLPGAGTQQDLAELLGVSRVTVNRALSRLRREGLIAPAPRTVRVLAPELLRLRAATSD